MRARNSGTREASIVNPAACLWPPKRRNTSEQCSSAASMLKSGMLRHDPWATSPSTESTMAGLWNASTSLEAARPMTPRCHPSPPTTRTVCAPPAGGGDGVRAGRRLSFDRFASLRDKLRFLQLPAQVFIVQLLGEAARFVPHRLVGGQEQACRDVGRAHAASRVDPRSEHERDLIAVDRLSAQP